MFKKLNILTFILTTLITVTLESVKAQEIITDGDTATIVTEDGNRITIDGNTLSQDGKNLFHSFKEFGLSNEQIATFLTNPNIQNILTRITGGNPSYINGLIEVSGGNSNLYLMNPAGIIFGQGASLNVPADFTATTATGIGFDHGIFNAIGTNDYANLTANPISFIFNTDQPGSIINNGEITVTKGANVSLIGGNVISTGTIETAQGKINIQAVKGTSRVKITPEGSLLSLEVDLPVDEQGNALGFTPQDLPTLLTGGNTAGVGTENIAVNPDGMVVVEGAIIPEGEGVAIASGSLSTASMEAGGDITLLGEQVGVVKGTLDATGNTAGGQILIGGEQQGQGTLPNAENTYISADSQITADALTNGDGGTIIVYADNYANVNGQLSARGGSQSGDGGFIETSGGQSFNIANAPDVGAVNGLGGEWLIDPNNIRIVSGTAQVNFDPLNPFVSNGDNALLGTATIQTALLTGDVTITTGSGGTQAGDITWGADTNLDYDGIGTGRTLTLNAINDITFNGGIDDFNPTSVDSLNVSLIADADGDGVGSFSGLGSGSVIKSGGGNILLSANQFSLGSAGGVRLDSTSNTLAGNITLEKPTGILVVENVNFTTLDATSTSGASGDITINAPDGIQINDPLTLTAGATNNLIFSTTGDFVVNPANVITSNGANVQIGSAGTPVTNVLIQSSTTTAGGLLEINASNNVTFDNANQRTGGGNFTINAGGDVNLLAPNPLLVPEIATENTSTGSSGGNLTIIATGDINIPQIDTDGFVDGGDVILTSQNGSISNDSLSARSSSSGDGGLVNFTALNGDITLTGLVDNSGGSGVGGAVNVQARNNIQAGVSNPLFIFGSRNGTTGSGDVLFDAGGTITFNGGINPNGANLRIGTITQPTSVSITGGLTTDFINADLEINSVGDITYTTGSPVDINVNNGDIFFNSGSGSITTNRLDIVDGNLDINVGADINITNRLNVSGSGNPITLNAGGNIDIGSSSSNVLVNTNGRAINLTAGGTLATSSIDTQVTSGDGGSVSLNSTTGDITTFDINSSGSSDGGAITINSDSGNIVAGNLTANGTNLTGAIDIQTNSGSITLGNIETFDNLNNNDVSITLRAASAIDVGTINFGANTNISDGALIVDTPNVFSIQSITAGGTDVNIGSANQPSSINIQDITATAGNVSLNSAGSINISGTIDTQRGAVAGAEDGGNVTVNASQNINLNDLNTSGRFGGNVLIDSTTGNVITNNITTQGTGFGQAGSISVSALNGTLNLGNLDAFRGTGGQSNNGSITLDSGGNINVGTITLGALNTGGTATLTIDNDEQLTINGSINSNGANVLLGTGTPTNIDITGNIISSGADVILNAINSINIGGFIDAQSSAGDGGNVSIISGQDLVTVSGTFIDNASNTASIASSGNATIIISHNGNSLTPNIPFTVGDATVNGTAGSIFSGTEVVNPVQSFPNTFISPNGTIQIISTNISLPIVAANDGTNTLVTSSDGLLINITGGTLSGDGQNLFQSFTRFDLPQTDQTANFVTVNTGIQNILARISSGDASIVNGTIQVSGLSNPNLYLMNPSGIVFGNNATLNVTADFIATNATGIGFGQNWFSAEGLYDASLLNNNPDSLAFSATESGAIINSANLNNGTAEVSLLAGTQINTSDITNSGTIRISAIQDQNILDLNTFTVSPASASPTLPNTFTSPILTLDSLVTTALGEGSSNLGVTILGTNSLQIDSTGIAVNPGDISTESLTLNGQGNLIQILANNNIYTQNLALPALGGGDVIVNNLAVGNIEILGAIDASINPANNNNVSIISSGNLTINGDITRNGNLGTGTLTIDSGGDLNLASINVGSNVSTPIDITANDNISTQNINSFNDLNISNLNVGDIDINGEINLGAGNLTLNSLGGVNVTGDITRTNGDGQVLINSENNLTIANIDSVSFAGTDVTLSSNTGSIVTGNIRSNNDALNTQEDNGTIQIIAQGDITTGNLDSSISQAPATVSSSGDITVTSNTGNVVVNSVITDNNAINTSDTGNISIQALSGDITIVDRIQNFAGSQTQIGDIDLNAGNNLTIVNGINPFPPNTSGFPSSINLTAGNNLVISGNALIDQGDFNLTSGNSITTADILTRSGQVGQPAGDIIIDATGNIVTGNLSTSPFAGAIGTRGKITINSSSGSVTTGAIDSSVTEVGGLSTDAVEITAFGDITTEQISTRKFFQTTTNITANGGDVSLTSNNGNINVNGAISSFVNGAGDSGNITLQAAGNISTDAVLANVNINEGDTGNGGNISFTSNNGDINITGNIATSTRDGSGGNIFLSGSSLNLTGTSINSFSSATGDGGNVQLEQNQGIFTLNQSVNVSSVDGLGGIVNIDSPNGIIIDRTITGSTNTNNPVINLNTAGDLIFSSGIIESQGGDVTIGLTTQPNNILVDSANTNFRITTSGGNVDLNALNSIDLATGLGITTSEGNVSLQTTQSDIQVSAIDTSVNNTNNAGTVNIISGGNLLFTGVANVPALDVTSAGGTGGDVTLQAPGNISTTGAVNLGGGSFTVDTLSSLTFNGLVTSNGGATNLNIGSNLTPIDITFGNGILTQGGSITVNNDGQLTVNGNIETQGGSIVLGTATPTTIDISGNVISSGGDVTLNAINSIDVGGFIDAQTSLGDGGNVTITSNQNLVRVAGTFLDNGSNTSSIASSGNASIIISHNGNGLSTAVPFVVGDASLNGTTGAIFSGTEIVNPVQSFPNTFISPNGTIQIISTSNIPLPIVAANDGTNTLVSSSDGLLIDIEGGTLSGDGQNLFQSFIRFDLPQVDQIANFITNTTGIQNILARISSGDASIINGTIQVGGVSNPNLYLMNPSGIVFGNNATLNVPADFIATTATGIGFADNWFSAEGVYDATLLNSNPDSLAFTVTESGAIINTANLNNDGASFELLAGSQVNVTNINTQGEVALSAIQGEQILDLNSFTLSNASTSATLPNAFTSPILTLDSLVTTALSEGASNLGVTILGNNSLQVDATGVNVALGEVVASDINTTGNDVAIASSGKVNVDEIVTANTVTGGNVSITSGDTIELTRIFTEVTDAGGQGGNINLDAVNSITATGSLDSGLGGTAGAITVNSDNSFLDLQNINANSDNNGTFGTGNNVTLTAQGDITTGSINNFGGIAGGNTTITTGGNFTNNGIFSESANGVGGDITVIAEGDIVSTLPFRSGAAFTGGNSATAGNVNLTSNNASITFSNIEANSDANGSGGDVIVTASGNITGNDIFSFGGLNGGDVTVTSGDSIQVNAISTDANNNINGQGGNITLSAPNNITATNTIRSGSFGTAGAISITSNNASINLANLEANSNIDGNGNNINVSAGDSVTTANIITSAGLNGGNVIINSGNTIQTGTIITNSNLSLPDNSPSNNFRAGNVLLNAVGDIQTQEVQAFSPFDTNGGNITIISQQGSFTAEDNGTPSNLSTTSAFNNTQDEGNSGNIRISAFQSVSAGNILTTATADSGNITVIAGQNVDIEGNVISTNTNVSEGIINLVDITTNSSNGNSGAIQLRAQGDITANNVSAFSPFDGNGGNVDINSVNGLLTINNINTDVPFNDVGDGGNGGDVSVFALNGINVNSLRSNATNNGGNISIDSDGAIAFSGSIVSSGNIAGGNITINSGDTIQLTEIFSEASNINGQGGNITLSAPNNITATGTIRSGNSAGIAGIITITSDNSFLSLANIEANGNGDGTGNNVILTAPNNITAGNIITSAGLNAGDITINSQGNVEVGSLNTSIFNSTDAQAGNINITGETSVNVESILIRDNNPDSTANVTLNSSGAIATGDINASNITFNTPQLITTGNIISGGNDINLTTVSAITTGSINSSGESTDSGGDINLQATGDITINGEVRTSSEGSNITEDGGNINIQTEQNLTINGDVLSRSCAGGSSCGDVTSGDVIGGDGGDINLSAGNNLQVTGIIDARSFAFTDSGNAITGNGGNLSLTAGDNLTVAPSVIPTNPLINTSSFANATLETTASQGGSVTLQAGEDINLINGNENFPSIDASSFALGTNSNTGEVNSDNAGNVNLNAGNVINLNSGINTNSGFFCDNCTFGTRGSGGNIELRAVGDIAIGDRLISAALGTGGDIIIENEGNVSITNGVNAGSSSSGIGVNALAGEGGNVDINTSGNVDITGSINTSSFANSTLEAIAGGGGNVTINAEGSVNLRAINTSSSANSGNNNTTTAQGGNVNITSSDRILTGDINTSSLNEKGGNISISGIGNNIVDLQAAIVKLGNINTSSQLSDAGDINISFSTAESGGVLEIESINAQGGSNGRGGIVELNSDQLLKINGTFLSSQQQPVSISTIGSLPGDSITIVNGGNGEIAFEIGNNSTNGSAGSIVSSENAFVEESLFFTETRDNISFVSVDAPIIEEPTVIDESPTEVPEPTDESQINKDFNRTPNQREQLELVRKIQQEEQIQLFFRPSLVEAKKILQKIEMQTGEKPMLIYVDFTPRGYQPENIEEDFVKREISSIQEYQQRLNIKQKNIEPTVDLQQQDDDILDILIVTANADPIRIIVPVTRKEVVENAAELWSNLADIFALNDNFKPYASNLYRWLITPIEKELAKQEIEITNLLFILPTEIRFTPIAALYDAEQEKFLVEKYSSGLAPSLNLNNNLYRPIQEFNLLAMGASNFVDSEVEPLPAVGIELPTIKKVWSDEVAQNNPSYINDNFTLEQIKSQLAQKAYGIVHFGTHGEFNPGEINNSFIQLYDAPLKLNELRNLGLNDPLIELMVLSACETAFGNEIAELGFAGLAVQSGVKTAMGSVWQVSDTGTLALMTDFYSQLKNQTTKSEALRQAQLNLLRGKVYQSDDGLNLITPDLQVSLAQLPEEVRRVEDLSHPFYWAPFTMIGNPW